MRVSGTITIVSGTAQHLSAISRPATRIIIQNPNSATGGDVYVFTGVPSTVNGTAFTPTTSNWPYITLGPPTATAPGDAYTDATDTGDESFFDIKNIWIDGSHSGDAVTFSYNLKN